ncbi:hypothetical protein RDI58_000908 [Solanum bulbocastanum]|uniref:Alliinase C-terminal domain-containing protein n=1 Tax=Solanum bulbocastanum TaxID=147425 RepID=A0AAN8U449_SOLBU
MGNKCNLTCNGDDSSRYFSNEVVLRAAQVYVLGVLACTAHVERVNGDQGKLIYDLAYYWPQYTSITSPANRDVMLFTISKYSGHAGSIIGWALVKDKEVSRKMTKFMEISTLVYQKKLNLELLKFLKWSLIVVWILHWKIPLNIVSLLRLTDGRVMKP